MRDRSQLDIIDADGHIVEPEAAWTEFLEPRFREFVPRPADMALAFVAARAGRAHHARARTSKVSQPVQIGQETIFIDLDAGHLGLVVAGLRAVIAFNDNQIALANRRAHGERG